MLSMWHPTTSSRHCKGSSVSPQAEFGIVTTCPGGKGGSFRDVASWHLSCSFFKKKVLQVKREEQRIFISDQVQKLSHMETLPPSFFWSLLFKLKINISLEN